METNIKSKVLDEFQEITTTLINPYLKEWKENGGKIMGYFCTHVPDELITAAGMYPFRMRATGSTGTDLADAYFITINCSFPRHLFNLAMRGEFEILDGLIVPNSCDHVRRIYDNWIRQIDKPSFVRMFNLTKQATDHAVEWYRDEVLFIKNDLEENFGVKITADDLKEAIKIHNETRRLLRQLYDLRKLDNPPITGEQALAAVVASTAIPREKYNSMLKELLEELKSAEGIKDYKFRLMIAGGILDDPEYMNIVEDHGGLVVTDYLCFGTRLFLVDIDEEGDPIEAIARYQVQQRPTCPRTYGDQPRRAQFMRDLIKDFKVDGVVGERLLFCDSWLMEHYMNKQDLKELGVPFLQLDREYILAGKGQLRTRMQAFLEMIGG
ncbi:MAG: 2-hydroxyacyl-CoA dehydratase family protein [Dehalococcoidia bacterium]